VSDPRKSGPPRLVCIDKPVDMTSFGVVRRVRQITGYRRVGHGGTLDPFATGVLVLGLGPATRLMRFLAEGGKAYEAEIAFGSETDSEDRTGEVIRECGHIPSAKEIRSALPEFVGKIDQVPPRLSAIHVDGERSYRRARRGEVVELPARQVEVHSLELLSCEGPAARLRIECGGGTYIRSLARDLGRSLDGAAHLVALRRTRVGPFTADDALGLDDFARQWEGGARGFDPAFMVGDWPRLELDAERAAVVRNGGQPQPEWWAESGWAEVPENVALLDPDGRLLAIAGARSPDALKLSLVLPEDG